MRDPEGLNPFPVFVQDDRPLTDCGQLSDQLLSGHALALASVYVDGEFVGLVDCEQLLFHRLGSDSLFDVEAGNHLVPPSHRLLVPEDLYVLVNDVKGFQVGALLDKSDQTFRIDTVVTFLDIESKVADLRPSPVLPSLEKLVVLPEDLLIVKHAVAEVLP